MKLVFLFIFKSNRGLIMKLSPDKKTLLQVDEDDLEEGKFTIPASVTHIGDYAFSSCEGLTQVTIPDSVTHIGKGAFIYCALEQLTIPGSVTSIGDEAFHKCFDLEQLTIPGSVTSIGKEAFSFCEGLKQVTILDGVTHIGKKAFSSCNSLEQVTIPGSVTSIGKEAFSYCDCLEQVTIPGSVTHIGKKAFSECTSLKQVTIPGSVTSIGKETFRNCTSLNQVTIPRSVKQICDGAFRDCTSLTKVTIPDSVTDIGNSVFRNCASLTKVTIPRSVTHIGNSVFRYCRSLTQVTIPRSVTSIGLGAFEGCTLLNQVTIPRSVTSIGDYAFYMCQNLKVIAADVDTRGEYKRIHDLLSPAEKSLLRPLSVLKEAQEIKHKVLTSAAACSMTALTALLVSKMLNYKGTIAGNHGLPLRKTTFFKPLKEDRFSALLSRPVSGSELSRLVPGMETGEPQIVKSLPKHAQMLRHLYTQRAIELHRTVAHIPLPASQLQFNALFKCVAEAALPFARRMFLNPLKQVKPSEKAPEAPEKRTQSDAKLSDESKGKKPRTSP